MVPVWARPLVAVALPVAEVMVAVLLFTGAFTPLGAVAAGALLAVSTVAVTVMLARGVEASCGCFGGGQSLSWRMVVRNLVLLACCAAVAAGPGRWTLSSPTGPAQGGASPRPKPCCWEWSGSTAAHEPASPRRRHPPPLPRPDPHLAAGAHPEAPFHGLRPEGHHLASAPSRGPDRGAARGRPPGHG